jgi:hypothetical protein
MTRAISTQTALLVEEYVKSWLSSSRPGRNLLKMMTLNEAVDAVYETLNAGFTKLQSNGQTFTGIVLCYPPQPPAAPIVRPTRH